MPGAEGYEGRCCNYFDVARTLIGEESHYVGFALLWLAKRRPR